jgi:uncharacterized protein
MIDMPINTPPPSKPAPPHDLTDDEFAELDDLFLETPDPLDPVDVVMLDGYLCCVIVQPVPLEAATWLPYVFDFDGQPLPESTKPKWLQRTSELIMRRHAALTRSIAEDGWFEPLVLEFDDEPSDTAEGETEPVVNPLADFHPISQSLMPWVAGFQHAAECFPDLSEMTDDAVQVALARLYRHLPVETDEEREVVAILDREHPLTTLENAMEELVATVADLQDLTSKQRYKVDTVKREEPKVGRNDPCPCGNGKKFKQCHGAT